MKSDIFRNSSGAFILMIVSGSMRFICVTFTGAALPYRADNWRMKNKRNNLNRLTCLGSF